MMISFRKSQETDSIIIYEMAATSAGRIQINKQTKEIKILDPGDEDPEELKGIVKDYLIDGGYPDRYTYAEG